MTDWIAIIQRAAYTRFCKTGSMDPFQLKRWELIQLATQSGAGPQLDWEAMRTSEAIVRIQVIVPVPQIGRGVAVVVDEWTRNSSAPS